MATVVATLVALTPNHSCLKTFTYHMDTRAAIAVYRGTREVPKSDHHMLRRIAHCQRKHKNVQRSIHFNNSQRLAHKSRVHERELDQQMSPAIASYYTTEGVGACGYGSVQTGYRFASLILACGTVIRICHYSNCAYAEMVDHGPYVAGRTFDLNYNLKNALGCGGICAVRWRLR